MAIDHSIYNNLIRPAKSVAEYDAEAMANQQNKLTLQVGQNKLADYQRGLQEEAGIADVHRSAVGADGQTDRNKLYSGMAAAGYGAKLQGMQKGYAEIDETAAKTKGETLKNDEAHIKNVNLKMGQVRDLFTTIQTPEQAAQLTRGMYADPDLGKLFSMKGDTVDAAILRIPTDPTKFAEWHQAASLKADELAKYRSPDANAKLQAKTSTDNSNADNAQSNKNSLRTAQSAAVGHGLKAEENSINRAGIVGKRTQDVEMKLQDDYRSESKGFAETSTAMKKILGAISTADKNPGSALAAGTAFMKILDPNSVVRESELGMALNASGWFDRATNIATTLQSGRVMTKTQQQNLRAASEDLFEEAKAAQREVDGAYKKRATDYGADPERVIVNRGQNTGRGGASVPVRITTDAEHAKLPSGALFITPDGQTRRKP